MNGLYAGYRIPGSGNSVATCSICGSYAECRCDEIEDEEETNEVCDCEIQPCLIHQKEIEKE